MHESTRNVKHVRFRAVSLALLLIVLVVAACGPKGTNTVPGDEETGSLQIIIEGLTGVAADVSVTGPDSFSRDLTDSEILEDLPVGTYTVTAAAVAGHEVSGVSSWTVELEKDRTEQVTVVYAAGEVAEFGTLRIEVEGLAGTDADVTVTGPGSFPSTAVTGDITLSNLVPGAYNVTSADVVGFVVSGERVHAVDVTAGTTSTVTVTYVAATAGLGSLEFDVQGLAPGATASLLVTGPDFSETVSGSTPLVNLNPGRYTVAAQALADHFLVDESTVEVDVVEDAAVTAVVHYLHAALALTGDTEAVVPLQGSRSLTFAVSRIGEMAGPVSYTVDVPAGISVTPASGTVPAGTSELTLVFSDDGGTVVDYNVSVEVSGTIRSHNLEAAAELTARLAPVVTDGSDDSAAPAPGSLRSLLADVRTTGLHITFAPELVGESGITIDLDGTLEISKPVGVNGPDGWDDSTGPLIRLNGGSTHRVVTIGTSTETGTTTAVVLSNLQLHNGAATNGAGVMVDTDTEILLDQVWVHGNAAGTHGGGIWVGLNAIATVSGSRIEANTASVRGAGLYVDRGTLTLNGSVVTGNSGAQNGGGVMAFNTGGQLNRTFLNIVDSTISENNANNGAGVYSHAEAVIQGSLIQDNVAHDDGGGIRNHLRMEINDTVIEDNVAGRDYGGLFNDGILTITDSWVRRNNVSRHGGGIFNGWYGSDTLGSLPKQMTIERTEISGNTADADGGGVHSVRRLTVIDSYIIGNIADEGAGIYSISVPHENATLNDGGSLFVTGTTLALNEAATYGGGIFSATRMCYETGCLDPFSNVPESDVHVVNSTFTLNRAGWGGGMNFSGDNLGEIRLNFNTIVNNTANGEPGLAGQGGGIINSRPNLTIRGNLILFNSGTGLDSSVYDLYSASAPNQIDSDGYNMIYRVPDGDVLLEGTDITPVIGTTIMTGLNLILADHGGYAPTLSLDSDSDAIGAVPVAECLDPSGGTLTVDQRGESRPGMGAASCSIGAYEYQGG